MIHDFIVRAPVKTKPRLPKGNLHKLLITAEKLEIYSWENIYGNKTSEKLFSVKLCRISEAKFKKPLLNIKEGYCQIIYENEVGMRNHLELSVLNTSDLYRLRSGPYSQNQRTEEVTNLLKMLIDANESNIHFFKPLDIPLSHQKAS